MPHPFHVLCEKGGKPRNPPYRNSENALDGAEFVLLPELEAAVTVAPSAILVALAEGRAARATPKTRRRVGQALMLAPFSHVSTRQANPGGRRDES